MSNLRQWHGDLWTVDRPFKLFGVQAGNRMTIIRVGEQLILHSPVKFDNALSAEVGAFGKISYLISSNCFHYLHIAGWRNAYPQAKVVGPPAQTKLPLDEKLTPTYQVELEQQWQQTIKIMPIEGIPKLSEFAFIHLPSKTLVLTDLAFNIHEPLDWITRLFFKAYGVYQHFGPSRLVKLLIKDNNAFAQSLRQIEQYDVERIILAHGRVIESNGLARFKQAFAQYL